MLGPFTAIARRPWSLIEAFSHLADFTADLGGLHGRLVQLSVAGRDVRLSTEELDTLLPALVPLIRLMVLGAIETPVARLARRKAVAGEIMVRVADAPNLVVLDLHHDGIPLAEASVSSALATAEARLARLGGRLSRWPDGHGCSVTLPLGVDGGVTPASFRPA